MEKVAKKIVNCLDREHTIWNELDRMRMMLGIEILFSQYSDDWQYLDFFKMFKYILGGLRIIVRIRNFKN